MVVYSPRSRLGWHHDLNLKNSPPNEQIPRGFDPKIEYEVCRVVVDHLDLLVKKRLTESELLSEVLELEKAFEATIFAYYSYLFVGLFVVVAVAFAVVVDNEVNYNYE
jgi:hypothetical protein